MTEHPEPTYDDEAADLSAGFTPETRATLEETGIKLFELIAEARSISTSDPRIAEGGEYAEACQALVRLGLIRHPEGDPDVWITVDPTAVQAQVVTPMSQEGARLIQESAQWASNFTALRGAWRRATPSDDRGPFTYLHRPGIQAFMYALVNECEEELLTAQPQNRRDTGALGESMRHELDLLKRGAKLHTLYQHSARRNIPTREYAAAIAAHGGEVRTLDEFFNRLIIADRRIAVIPAPDNVDTAIAIREPAVVAYLADVFDRAWERARPFNMGDPSTLKDIASEQRSMTLRMLLSGYSDPSASKRLGVSPRTYAGYVADLKEEFDAETRFQLGYMIGRSGIDQFGLTDSDATGTGQGPSAESDT